MEKGHYPVSLHGFLRAQRPVFACCTNGLYKEYDNAKDLTYRCRRHIDVSMPGFCWNFSYIPNENKMPSAATKKGFQSLNDFGFHVWSSMLVTSIGLKTDVALVNNVTSCFSGDFNTQISARITLTLRGRTGVLAIQKIIAKFILPHSTLWLLLEKWKFICVIVR